MRITAFVTLAAAVLAFTDASPIARRPHLSGGHSVPLTRNASFKHNTRAQIAKLNKRYSSLQILAGSTGYVPLTDVSPDLEYYGTVSVGTPTQNVKLDFDTAHTRFNSAKSTSFQADGRKWSISYGGGSSASGILGSDLVSIGGISVRQTIGLATKESSQFGSSSEDGLFGLGFNTIESVSGVKTFLDNAIAAGVLAQPVVSYTGSLTYVPVTQKGYWQILVQDASYNGVSLGQTSQGIVDTGITFIIVDDVAAAAIHKNIPGSVNDPNNGWLVPCSAAASTAKIGFKLGGVTFNIPVTDLAYEELGDGSDNCFSGVQGGQDGLWILGDVFIKNNYCVFSQTSSPSIGIAPLAV
ncbi:Type I transmembrane sorting receptor [Mortierella sp. 14UC]|nr:Type I transmembrane sorting receptor [Mortierella sp. 14UC]